MNTTPGKLTVITGPMKSGKTAHLLDMVRETINLKQPYMVCKPSTDTRNGHFVASRTGEKHEATILIADFWIGDLQLYWRKHNKPRIIFFDEAQFFGINFPGTVKALLAEGIDVVVSGLDLDYATRPFITMAVLMSWSSAILIRYFGMCSCGVDAVYTQRLTTEHNRIAIGDEEYDPRCDHCYDPPPGVGIRKEAYPDVR